MRKEWSNVLPWAPSKNRKDKHLRKFKDHPAYRPVEVITPFKQTKVYVVVNDKTQQVLWSEKKYSEADAMAKAMAQTLDVDIALLHVTIDHC